LRTPATWFKRVVRLDRPKHLFLENVTDILYEFVYLSFTRFYWLLSYVQFNDWNPARCEVLFCLHFHLNWNLNAISFAKCEISIRKKPLKKNNRNDLFAVIYCLRLEKLFFVQYRFLALIFFCFCKIGFNNIWVFVQFTNLKIIIITSVDLYQLSNYVD
jgi:hypothetical protein